jgi:rhodanese-related sulfurtransferase
MTKMAEHEPGSVGSGAELTSGGSSRTAAHVGNDVWDGRFGVSGPEVRTRASREDLVMLDVREADELERARISGVWHVPLSTFPSHLTLTPPDAPTVVVCHHGVRSAWVVHQLRRAGWRRVFNLDGGIDAWYHEVDPSVGRY